MIVLCSVPNHGSTRVDPCPVFLHNDAGDYVLVRLVEGLELLQTVVDDRVRPVRHLHRRVHRDLHRPQRTH